MHTNLFAIYLILISSTILKNLFNIGKLKHLTKVNKNLIKRKENN